MSDDRVLTSSLRIGGTAGRWTTLTVRFRPGDDLLKATGYGESVTVPISKALMEAFGIDVLDIDEIILLPIEESK